ncbi:MAG TPA: hypothetical protein VGM34_01030, partial [Chlamydiales bacterium]
MKAASISNFFTTSIVNSNRAEQFADGYLLAPLHYLLGQAYSSSYPRKYQVGADRKYLKQEASTDSLFIRVLKIFAACIGAFLFTLPGALIKRLAQCEQTSLDKHQTLHEFARRLFFSGSQGPLFRNLVPFLSIRDVNALSCSYKGSELQMKVRVENGQRVMVQKGKVVTVRFSGEGHRELLVWQTFFARNKVSLWRPVAQRFPSYEMRKDALIYEDPRQFVEWESLGFRRMRTDWNQQ